MKRLLARWAGGSVLSLSALGLPAAAQTPAPETIAPQIEACLHGRVESPAQRARREEALAAMRMIDYVSRSGLQFPGRMSWERLSRQPEVARLEGMDGAVGELARKIDWRGDEPLPGWRITWIPGPPQIVFALTDTRDPCEFKYSSTDPDVIPEEKGGIRLLPLDMY
jgi:hypothetical protein